MSSYSFQKGSETRTSPKRCSSHRAPCRHTSLMSTPNWTWILASSWPRRPPATCDCRLAVPRQAELQMRTNGGPFDIQNRVHHGVPPRSVRHQLMAAQNPVEFRAEPLDRRAAGEVEVVCAEFDCHTIQHIECVAQHQ